MTGPRSYPFPTDPDSTAIVNYRIQKGKEAIMSSTDKLTKGKGRIPESELTLDDYSFLDECLQKTKDDLISEGYILVSS